MSSISLKSSHIYLEQEIVTPIFGEIHYAYVTFVKEKNNLLITPVNSQWFVKMYEPTQFLLKERNLKGDRTLAIREILIDNDLDMTDRDLEFNIIKKTNLIKVSLQ